MTDKKEARCNATQSNRRAPDFDCRLKSGAHNIHVDSRTGERWGDGQYPRGWNRRWTRKKYANRKLSRQSAVMGRR